MTQDSESVVVPRDQQRQLDAEQLMDAAGTLSRCGYGEDAEEVRAIALRLAAAPSTSVREELDAAQIDAGARYLREVQQGGKKLTPWAETPKATKKKWLTLSEGVLRAALVPSPDEGKRHG